MRQRKARKQKSNREKKSAEANASALLANGGKLGKHIFGKLRPFFFRQKVVHGKKVFLYARQDIQRLQKFVVVVKKRLVAFACTAQKKFFVLDSPRPLRLVSGEGIYDFRGIADIPRRFKQENVFGASPDMRYLIIIHIIIPLQAGQLPDQTVRLRIVGGVFFNVGVMKKILV